MTTPTVTAVENKRRRVGPEVTWYMMRQLGGCQHVREFTYNLHHMSRREAAQKVYWQLLLLRRSVAAQRQDMMDARQAAMERYLGE